MPLPPPPSAKPLPGQTGLKASLTRWFKGLLQKIAHRPEALLCAEYLLREHHRTHWDSFPAEDTFVLSSGREVLIQKGLRDLVIPFWNIEKAAEATVPDWNTTLLEANAHLHAATEARDFLELHGIRLQGTKLLDIGSGSGAKAFCLAAFGAQEVTATTYTPYYLDLTLSADEKEQRAARDQARRDLMRKAIEHLTGVTLEAKKVTFVEDDMSQTSLSEESIDGAFSFEVLEHIQDPPRFFEAIQKTLVPRGFSFTSYNPFFSSNGGHAAATLDFPWGHARVTQEDLSDYLKKFRHQEFDVGLNFWSRHLNRLTLKEMNRYSQNAGLQCLATLPWADSKDYARLEEETLQDVMRLYPSATVLDLISPKVWVLHQSQTKASRETV